MVAEHFNICGVLPPHLQFFRLLFHEEPELIFPIYQDSMFWKSRGAQIYQAIVRLRPDAKPGIAAAELNRIASVAAPSQPSRDAGVRVALIPLRKAAFGSIDRQIAFLFAAVMLLLAVSWSNLASLSLVRSASRHAEWATRAALGAPIAKAIAPVFREALLIATAGGLLGVALTRCGLAAVLAVLSVGSALAGLEDLTLGIRAIAFAGLAAICSAASLAIPAAVEAARTGTAESIRSFGYSRPLRSLGVLGRQGLIAIEAALVVVLLYGAGFLAENVRRLSGRPLGHEYANTLTLRVALPMRAGYRSPAEWSAFTRQLADRVMKIPGVRTVDTVFPLTAKLAPHAPFTAEGAQGPRTAAVQYTGIRYLRNIGAAIADGRFFSDDEDCDRSPHPAMVNAALSRLFWPGQSPIGRTLSTDSRPPTAFRVVGVVRDILDTPTDTAEPVVYSCEAQNWNYFVIKSARDPANIAGTIQTYIRSLGKDIEISDITTLDDLVAVSMAPSRTQALVLVLFSAAALAISLIGVYGLAVFLCNGRRKEFAIRQAVGASPRSILYCAARDTLAFALLGAGVGGLAIAIGSSAGNRIVLLGAVALPALAAFVAACIPPLRVSRGSLSTILRAD